MLAEGGRRPRRILLLVYWLAHGGMEQQTIFLANAHAALGDEVTIGYGRVNPDHEVHLDPRVKLLDLDIRSPAQKLLAVPGLARVARRADIVHCTGWDASLWGRLAAIIARRPVVITEHTSPGRETQAFASGRRSNWFVALHNRALDPFTAVTVAVAEAQVEGLVRDGVRRRKITVIPNGVPLDAIRRAAVEGVSRADLGIAEDAKVVIQVGRFIPQKRQDWTYETISAIRDEVGDVQLVFAGEGPTEPALRQRARDDGASWAHFLGLRSDVPALLKLADLAVLPSQAEALPMVVIEALTLGVPQVATDVGDVRLMLERASAGIVVGRDDRSGYETACRRLLSDEELASQQSESGRAGANVFAIEAMAVQYDELFSSIIASRAERRRRIRSLARRVGR